METITANIYIGTKNDGLIQGNMARWKTSDSWTPNNKQNMRNQGNFYYDDDPDDATSGWNHSEMMRYERIYDGDNGLPAASIITPLKDNAQWMIDMLDQ